MQQTIQPPGLVIQVDLIDPSHKTHNASFKYPTMHHFVTETYTHGHISAPNGTLRDMGHGHCEIGLFESLMSLQN